MRRVVVTGTGLVSPLGCGNLNVWSRLIACDSGVTTLGLDIPGVSVSVAAKVQNFSVDEIFGKQSHKYKSLSTHYALHASDIALQSAGFEGGRDIDLCRAGVAIASGPNAYNYILNTENKAQILLNMAAGEVSIRHQLKGPNHCVATACAAGAHAIGDAYNFIRLGYADLMVAGGTEAPLDDLSVGGFASMRALSRASDPSAASRPFDAARDGFVIGEGAGLLVLESLESARQRGAPILAEICGYGLSGDAFHITSPAEGGAGAIRAMRCAMSDAGIGPTSIGYVNAHATSTPVGDAIEADALQAVFSEDSEKRNSPLYVSSTKGATGHMLGAAGAVEAAFTVMALNAGMLPPTLNLSLSSEGSQDDSVLLRSAFQHITCTAQPAGDLQYAMSNSFGFGGTNASLIFRKFVD